MIAAPKDQNFIAGPLKTRKQIRVTWIKIHEDYTSSMNDVALLKLGKETI